ncbi:MAG: ATP-binding protein [Bacteroidales bacterium]|nr:ATP-binding protein [Bacteroidales bacterium]
MPNRFNPFRPNHPVYTGLFAGRFDEIKKIDNALFQTSFDNPTNLLLIGERGIGKTSLLLVAKYFAQGEIVFDDKKHNFITIQLNISNHINSIDFILKFQNALKREINKHYKTQKIIDECWGFIKRLEISGFKINSKEKVEGQLLIDEFIFSLINTIKSIQEDKDNPKDGILVLIDEADTANESLGLGALLKAITETLVAENCNRILFILAGLPHVTDVLRASHESSPRLFEEIVIGPLNLDDTRHVVQQAESEINKVEPERGFKITDEAVNAFHNMSEGYPHFLQQIGFSTIALTNNNTITGSDVRESMFADGGALEIIGNRYYADLFYNKINVDSYRQILEIMAERWNEWITKEQIKKSFIGNDMTLTNGIKALRDRNIILSKRGVRGHYRLQWLSFAFWIKIHKQKINK